MDNCPKKALIDDLNQKFAIEVSYKGLQTTHDGYCSEADEFEEEIRITKKKHKIPYEFDFNDITEEGEFDSNRLPYYIRRLAYGEGCGGGSGYCGVWSHYHPIKAKIISIKKK